MIIVRLRTGLKRRIHRCLKMLETPSDHTRNCTNQLSFARTAARSAWKTTALLSYSQELSAC